MRSCASATTCGKRYGTAVPAATSGEGKQLLDQVPRAKTRCLRLFEIAFELHVPRDFLVFRCQHQVPEDSGENVVEVVRDPPRQVPYRLHLLRLPQLLLQKSALGLGRHAYGDIPRDDDCVGRAAVAHGDRPHLDIESLTVPADGCRLDLTRLAGEGPAYERV